VQQALDAGLPPATVLGEGMIAAMAEVGTRFEQQACFVPEMMLSARAMQAGLAVLKPALKSSNVAAAGTVAIGTVKGDLHDIGKNLVGMMLEGAGYTIVDLGVDVAPERFVEAARRPDVDLVALSALITTTLPAMERTVAALGEAGVRPRVKVMVGGAPVSAHYCHRIGADGYAPDASSAVALARSLVLPQA
jgi:5-methyltetrahydrofolate--homocysteine methyltransferase